MFDIRVTEDGKTIADKGFACSPSFVKRKFDHAVRLIPQPLRGQIQAMYAECVFPSQSTVSRSNLYVDASLMKKNADLFEELLSQNTPFFLFN